MQIGQKALSDDDADDDICQVSSLEVLKVVGTKMLDDDFLDNNLNANFSWCLRQQVNMYVLYFLMTSCCVSVCGKKFSCVVLKKVITKFSSPPPVQLLPQWSTGD
jgi:hypothetical protein